MTNFNARPGGDRPKGNSTDPTTHEVNVGFLRPLDDGTPYAFIAWAFQPEYYSWDRLMDTANQANDQIVKLLREKGYHLDDSGATEARDV